MSKEQLKEPLDKRLLKAASAVYLATEIEVATGISSLLQEAQAEIARLSMALEQAVKCGGLEVLTVVKDKSYDMWRYEGVRCIVGQSAQENFFAGHPDDNPELAAYLETKAGQSSPVKESGE